MFYQQILSISSISERNEASKFSDLIFYENKKEKNLQNALKNFCDNVLRNVREM